MTPSSVFSSAFSRMSLLALALSWFSAAPALAASDAPLATAAAQAAGSARAVSYDGVVEAVRQTQIAAQVPGAVVELAVHAGDRVTAGQLLVRIDARTADQGAVASAAQVQAGRANLAVAQGEFERQQQLHAKKYISAAALERAEGQLKAARAQVDAQSAQAGAARTGAGLHTVRAPYAGVVAEVPVQLGDMAMPGRPLLTLYDPAALRVTASVPQTSVTKLAGATPGAAQVRIELPGLPADQQPQAPHSLAGGAVCRRGRVGDAGPRDRRVQQGHPPRRAPWVPGRALSHRQRALHRGDPCGRLAGLGHGHHPLDRARRRLARGRHAGGVTSPIDLAYAGVHGDAPTRINRSLACLALARRLRELELTAAHCLAGHRRPDSLRRDSSEEAAADPVGAGRACPKLDARVPRR